MKIVQGRLERYNNDVNLNLFWILAKTTFQYNNLSLPLDGIRSLDTKTEDYTFIGL